ncbi:fatty acid oxidation complex subunit alpha FadB [Vibrio sp. SS-MA-C1-2]|uniref:fatty acid oxidation complex subunit alpha FadB n=1 Tax=Vibrio sp. SS-MA-C1-2 TaxID=2908646 RepID=UPI001F174AF0|nr:fatty acid oxidation complex subunit alpha FadB [Vibrio sp. SS-MA-C1-2]UJF19944.1 fatty acid oxidation complex subunit alpha FadB [Vibrio sp. SS-MA-C1-2]
MYQGNSFQVNQRGVFAELVFNDLNDPVNTLRKSALEELEKCVSLLANSDIKGLIIRSGKPLFSAGADVKAFRELFKEGEPAISEYLTWAHSIYNKLEDLPFPKVAIVNGVAAGGGVELSLLAEYRLVTEDVKVSLPEVKLGILPAWGGATRLPRILGVDTALQWLTTGKTFKATSALTLHYADGIISRDADPIAQAEKLLTSCINNEFDWKARQKEKGEPLTLNQHELALSINTARGMTAKAAGKHYPAPYIILDCIEHSAYCHRDEALSIERKSLNQCVESGVADALVSIFLADMAVKGKSKKLSKNGEKTDVVGVIGAGIMGGGIAYVSAYRKMDIVLKDINKAGLDLGLNEANKLLAKQVTRGKKSPRQMGETLNRIQPTLHNEPLEITDLIIEAVVENPMVKEKVLAELETIAPNAMIASNTSTLMISGLAQALKKPENFCGIHFFNPVPRMPLVEVIRGEKSSDQTIEKAVKYVTSLGKTPIVVNDCAGFLVNRCLTPYFLGFNQLLIDGGDIPTIDKVMSKQFGWPMGPALLLDVIGLDTTAHCIDVMDDAFPNRLTKPEVNIFTALLNNGKQGQKNSEGFYSHVTDKRGRLRPQTSESSHQLIESLRHGIKEFSTDEITMRLMIPMMFEAIRCLDEGIVASPEEADIAMIYGTGFPAFRGGLFYYMDLYGLDKLANVAKTYQHLGALYHLPEGLISRINNNQKFYA